MSTDKADQMNEGEVFVPEIVDETSLQLVNSAIAPALGTLREGGWDVSETHFLAPADREVTKEEFLSKAAIVGRIGRAARTHIGDLARQMNHRFGESYADLAKVSGYTVDTIKQSVYAMAHVPPENRFEGLTFYHMRLAADVKPEEQGRLLLIASGQSEEVKTEGVIGTEAFDAIVKQVKKDGLDAVVRNLTTPVEGAETPDTKQAQTVVIPQPFNARFRPREPKEKLEDYEASLRAVVEEAIKRHLDPKYKIQQEAKEQEERDASKLSTKRERVQGIINELPEGNKDRKAYQKALDRAKTAEDLDKLKTDATETRNALQKEQREADKVTGALNPFGETKQAKRLKKIYDKQGYEAFNTELKALKKVNDKIAAIEAESDKEPFIERFNDGKTAEDLDKLLKAYIDETKRSARETRKDKLDKAASLDKAAAELRAAEQFDAATEQEQKAKQLRWEADGGKGTVPATWMPKGKGK